MIKNPSTSEPKKAQGVLKPQSKHIIKPIITNRYKELFHAEDFYEQLKKKGQVYRYKFRNRERYIDEDNFQDEENTFQSLSKVLKSSNKTQKLKIGCYVYNLEQTGAKHLCEGIKSFRSLKSLEIKCWGTDWIGDAQLHNIAKALKNLTSLENLKLSLGWCGKEVTVPEMKYFYSALKSLISLKRIHLRFGNWEDIQKMAKVLKTMASLESITLVFCSLKDVPQKDLQSLGQAFNALPSLKSLDFRFVYEVEIQGLGLRLSQVLREITGLKRFVLDFEECPDITDKEVQSLGEGLESLFSLQELSINFEDAKNITDIGLQSLGKRIQNLKNLKEINLDFSIIEITNIGFSKIWQDLSSLTQLENIDIQFSNNPINDEGMKILPQVLNKFICLKHLALGLAFSQVKDKGLQSLFQGLKNLILLESFKLNLHGCKITDVGVKLLWPALKMLTRLQDISITLLSCEKVTDAGLIAIIQNFKIFTSLKAIALDFSQCKITDFGLKQLGQSMKYLTGLQRMDLRFDHCSKISHGAIRSLCKDFTSLKSLNSIILGFRRCGEKEEALELEKNLKAFPSCPSVKIHVEYNANYPFF